MVPKHALLAMTNLGLQGFQIAQILRSCQRSSTDKYLSRATSSFSCSIFLPMPWQNFWINSSSIKKKHSSSILVRITCLRGIPIETLSSWRHLAEFGDPQYSMKCLKTNPMLKTLLWILLLVLIKPIYPLVEKLARENGQIQQSNTFRATAFDNKPPAGDSCLLVHLKT